LNRCVIRTERKKMPEYRRAYIAGGTYFFTVVTYRRQQFLCDNDGRTALRDGINKARERYPFTIDAWVLLPDHLHCIWTLPDGDADFGSRWAAIKRYVSKNCPRLKLDDRLNESKRKRKESTVWQRRFWEHMIRDERDYEMHLNYIHYNPVRHGIVKHVKDWPYSTFHRYVENNAYPPDWGGMVDEYDGKAFGE